MKKTKKITSNEFISLFIALLQIRFLKENTQGSYLGINLFFSSRELKEFIYYSKRNPEYSDFLECFTFINDKNTSYSVELSTSINYAIAKKLITASNGDIHYISRSYVYGSVVNESWEWIQLMERFIDDFNIYRNNPKDYMDLLDKDLERDQEIQFGTTDRFRFNLQRRIREQKVNERFKDKKE